MLGGSLEKRSIRDVVDYLNFHHTDVQFCIEKSALSRITEKNTKDYLESIILSHHQHSNLANPVSKKFRNYD